MGSDSEKVESTNPYIIIFLKTSNTAQSVKPLLCKADDLRPIPGAHIKVKGKKLTPQNWSDVHTHTIFSHSFGDTTV